MRCGDDRPLSPRLFISITATATATLVAVAGCHDLAAPPTLHSTPLLVVENGRRVGLVAFVTEGELPPLEVVEPLRDGGTPVGLARLCSENLAEAHQRFMAIAAASSQPTEKLTWRETFGRFDEVRLAIANAADYGYLLGVVHPDESMRSVAGECERQVDAFETELGFHLGVAKVLARAAANNSEPRSEERQRFVERVLREFANNGLNLAPEGQARLRILNEGITEAGQAFIEAIAVPAPPVRVPSAALAGTSEAFRRAHPPGSDGLVPIAAEPPDSIEFYAHALDRKAAARVYTAFVNRGGEGNLGRLEKLLALRYEKAHLLGFESWADYVTSLGMLHTASAARAFLRRIEGELAPAVAKEMTELVVTWKRTPGASAKARLEDPDRLFLTERQKAERQGFEPSLIANYFEVEAVTRGLFQLAGSLFGLTFEERPIVAWHPSVKSYEVRRHGRLIGGLLLDRFARANKYPNPATFSLRTGHRGGGGAPQLPISAVVAALPEPGQPMPHEAVVMFFHEFGHVLQHLLSENELATFSGTNAARDFIETPSQWFEEWAWSPAILESFARHRTTGAKLPKALIDSLLESRQVGFALGLQRQLFLAELDLAFHTTTPPFDTTALLQKVQAAHYPFAPLAGTHLQSSLSHLVGYDAAYYGYTLSQALAADVWTRFGGDASEVAQAAEDWRRTVLQWGGAHDERAMLRAFLGRDVDEHALFEGVFGGSRRARPSALGR